MMAGVHKASRLKKARLYLILDREVAGEDRLFAILRQAVAAGVDVVQLRDKDGSAAEMIVFCRRIQKFLKGRIPLILNDRVDLAVALGADGVHVGQDDIPVSVARRLCGPKMLIGVSCQTLAQARRAQQQGADYIGFGSVFKTLTKPERRPQDLKRLGRVVKTVRIPVFAIGGINTDNVNRLCSYGVNRIAVTRSIGLADQVARTVHRFQDILAGTGR